MKKLLFLALLLPLAAHAQFGTATRVRVGSTLPATCAPGQIFFRSVTNVGIHECTATNTWTFTRGAAAGTIVVKVGGSTVGSPRANIDFLSGNGFTFSGNDDGTDTEVTGQIDTNITLTRATDQSGVGKACSTAGISTAYTCGVTPALTSYTTLSTFVLKVHTNSGASPTLNIDGVGARNLQKLSGGALANVGANDLDADAAYVIIVMASAFLVVEAVEGVVGPASATDNALTRFDATTGKLLQNSGAILSDTNDLTGVASIAFGADPADSGRIRLSNNEEIAAELATPGVDATVKLDANNRWAFSHELTGPGFRGTGSGAGFLEMTQGTAQTPSANSLLRQAPTAITTAYTITEPSAIGVSGVKRVSVSGAVATESHGTATVADGGTGITSGTSGGIPYFSSATAIASSAALTANRIIKGGGAGAAPVASGLTIDGSDNVTGATSIATGASPPTCTPGTAGVWCSSEGTAPTAAAGVGQIYQDSTSKTFMAQVDGGGARLLQSSGPSSINLTAQTASVTLATLCAATAGACNQAGMYRVDWNFTQDGTACTDVTAGSVAFNLAWTDSNGTAHVATQMPMLNSRSLTATSGTFTFETSNATANASGTFNVSSNGAAAIQYSTTYTACTTGTGSYRLRATATRLQ